MPYIKPADRLTLGLMYSGPRAETVGELNYLITLLCKDFLGDSPSYVDFNNIIGVLECVKLEFYRRAVTPYEDKKIKENGDVYD